MEKRILQRLKMIAMMAIYASKVQNDLNLTIKSLVLSALKEAIVQRVPLQLLGALMGTSTYSREVRVSTTALNAGLATSVKVNKSLCRVKPATTARKGKMIIRVSPSQGFMLQLALIVNSSALVEPITPIQRRLLVSLVQLDLSVVLHKQ